MSYIEYSGAGRKDAVETELLTQIDANISQAQTEQEKAQWQTVRAKIVSDGAALATSMAAFIEEHYKNIGTNLPNVVKFFSKGATPLSVTVDLVNGEDFTNAIVKGLLDSGTGSLSGMIGAAALGLAAPAASPFIIAGGAIVVGYIASQAVGDYIKDGVDYFIGVTDKTSPIGEEPNSLKIQVLSANLYNTLHEHYETLKTKSHWKIQLDAQSATTIEYENNTYTFSQSKSALKQDGSNLEVLLQYVNEPSFTLGTTTGTYELTNLLHKSSGQLASLAKGDTAVMSALIFMKSYAISDVGGNFEHHLYSDEFIEAKAQMLYWYNMSKWHNLGMDAVNRELSSSNIYFEDMMNHISFGEGNFGIDNDKKIIFGSYFNDAIEGADYEDKLFGDEGNDVLIGNGGSDYLESGADSDTLIGGLEGGADDGASDHLEGGKGFDTYLVNNGDTIMDSDGEGLAKFDNIDLTGKKYKNEESGRYEDDDYIYDGDPDGKGPLVITSKDGSKSITISDWSNEDLGIELLDNKDIEVSITESASSSEGDSGKRSLSFTVSLSRALEDGESLDVSVSGTDEGSYTFQSGEQSKTFTHSWNGDTRDEGAIDHTATLTPSANYSGPSDDVNVTIKNSGIATVYDDDEDKRHDPLALDTNKDGFISTSDLKTSGTYFDITGDGLRERVGWIKSEDALVTYDKNDNGQIDGISEVFGNMNESGFEELKRLIDSNHDNIIDRKDELFNRLQVWNDFNQDAKVQEGELRSLKDAGVTSIDLNYVSTNIEINGNLLTEASKYTDAQGNKELAADIQLATDAKDTIFLCF